ncbi:MAG: aminotransferase class III-fold pyridoxal phosphate-dependent enzyme [Flavobacteriaceae bacterium]|nr:aminotransferase class III-fold pyridoxal phosphate-dependent enzyme [Flavobacteriaceae bacterium]
MPREFDWNLTQSLWTKNHLGLFTEEEKELIIPFQQRFFNLQNIYQNLPKSVVHNDLNDYNILVSKELIDPEVTGFIDFGDAVYTQTINDVAIVIAYAVMEAANPLEAALDILKGYTTHYRPTPEELQCLYILVAMRWITTVTKAAIRKKDKSNNPYHSISEQNAWDALKKWATVNEEFAFYNFRLACGMPVHPNNEDFKSWTEQKDFSFSDLFPTTSFEDVELLDLKVSSPWIGSRSEFNDLDLFEFKINKLQKKHPNKIIAGGYLEPRPLYTASSYDREGNEGPESRSVHLGVDFWLPAGTPIHSLFDAEVYAAVNDDGFKEYGGLVILKHEKEGLVFYSLYGHLSIDSVKKFQKGDRVKKGERIGELGAPHENGNWSPHLHFQLMLSILGFTDDFPGVCCPSEMELWKGLCPDPNLLFKNKNLKTNYDTSANEIEDTRKNVLGKGLSLSYHQPLHIVRGDGVYLMDPFGRKYLDTVNNVAHVGHEHPQVVAAAKNQISVLNTNTRYLHPEIINYAKALRKKLPDELSVLHFLNSGSEANELALRMAKTVTGEKDIVALEVGYHGNTSSVIDISSYKFDGKGGKGKPEHTHILPLPDPFRGKHEGDKSGTDYAAYLVEILQNLKKDNRKPAAFIGEAILSCGGQILPPPNYFEKVYELIRGEGGLCIADEVQTGFGRVGEHFWAFELHGVVPDIVTMGKPAGNGHPLAIVACTKEVAEQFNNGMEFFNTFGGNPVSCAIGRAVLDVVEDENLQQNALEIGEFLLLNFNVLRDKYPIIGDVRGKGLFLGIEFVDSNMNPLPEQADYFVNRMKDYKILMSTDGPDHNVIKIKPPMVFSKENAEELLHRMELVLGEDFMKLSQH